MSAVPSTSKKGPTDSSPADKPEEEDTTHRDPILPIVEEDDTVSYEPDLSELSDTTPIYEEEDANGSNDTIPYDADISFAARPYPMWHSSKHMGQDSLAESWAGYSELAADHLAWAVADAEYLLSCAKTESREELAWTASEAHFVIPGNFKASKCFWYDLKDDQCFSVSTDELLRPEEVVEFFEQVDKADRLEVASFVKNKVFELRRRNSSASNRVDGTWVRKWADRRLRIVKSRCCSRGFLDKQKGHINKHSSTASRLSHRLACTLGVQNGLYLESFDISTAFLQGLRFDELQQKARDLGYTVNTAREVQFIPPANFWRHLRSMEESKIHVEDHEIQEWILELLKAIYGLCDGPILFQLALLHFLTFNVKLTKSVHDHNFLTYADGWNLQCIVIIHVDDLLVFATWEWLRWLRAQLESRFGKLKNQTPPFVFIGITHEFLQPEHLYCHQHQYLAKLKPPKLDKTRAKQESKNLKAEEHFDYRSLVCSLLWLTISRMDIVADVVVLQQAMVTPTVKDLKKAIATYHNAVKNSTMNGLHFRKLAPPFRLANYNDSSHVSNHSLHPQEGRGIFLMTDPKVLRRLPEWVDIKACECFEGHANPLFSSAKKATRVSHSTSHGESLAFLGGAQIAQLLANRLTEPFTKVLFDMANPSPLQMLEIQNFHAVLVPIDVFTDCMDVWELVCNN